MAELDVLRKLMRKDPRPNLDLESLKTELTDLDLSRVSFTALPREVGLLQGLQTLDLQQSSLYTLTHSLSKLTNLRVLNLKKCNQLNAIPAAIGKLTNLRVLNLEGCRLLNAIPDAIRELTLLESLCPTYSNISSLPSTIVALQSLHTLSLKGCSRFHQLPTNLGEMKRLTAINVTDTSIQTLPDSVCDLPALLILKAMETNLCEFPVQMQHMTSLQTLHITAFKEAHSGKEVLFENVCEVTSLTTLKLRGGVQPFRGTTLAQKGPYIPDEDMLGPEIEKLTALTKLDLEDSYYNLLPAEIRKLTNLKTLILKGFKEFDFISLLPDEIKLLTALETLDIRDCYPLVPDTKDDPLRALRGSKVTIVENKLP